MAEIEILRKTIKLDNDEGWSPRGIEIKGVLKLKQLLDTEKMALEKLFLFLKNGTV